jgi:hypothetical protein
MRIGRGRSNPVDGDVEGIDGDVRDIDGDRF